MKGTKQNMFRESEVASGLGGGIRNGTWETTVGSYHNVAALPPAPPGLGGPLPNLDSRQRSSIPPFSEAPWEAAA